MVTTIAKNTDVRPDQPTLMGRNEKKDKLATRKYVEEYGNFICALALKFTASSEEAEAATQEIFMDISRYAERADVVETPDEHLMSLIARRHLVDYLH